MMSTAVAKLRACSCDTCAVTCLNRAYLNGLNVTSPLTSSETKHVTSSLGISIIAALISLWMTARSVLPNGKGQSPLHLIQNQKGE